MPRFRLRTAFVLLTGFSLSGCSLAGERAATGVCPAGQTCSSETSGLFFLGAGFSDGFLGVASNVAMVASGGTETVTALTGGAEDSPPFADGFTADVTDASEISIDAVTPPSVTLRGQAASGSVELELFQTGSTALLDEVPVGVGAISTVTLFPDDLVNPDSLFGTDTAGPWALLANSAAVPLIIVIKTSEGERLVDESATFSSAWGTAKRQAWDRFAVTSPPTVGQASFTMAAGGHPFAATAPVVAAVESIEMVGIAAGTVLSVERPYPTPVCYQAMGGGLPLAGVTWTLSPSANLTVQHNDSGSKACVGIVGTGDGPGALVVTASGISKTFTFTVSTKGDKSAPHRVSPRPTRVPVPGTRGASTLDER